MKYRIENPNGSAFCVATLNSMKEGKQFAAACSRHCEYVTLYSMPDNKDSLRDTWKKIGIAKSGEFHYTN